ncbi:putative hydrolase [Lachnospiraceae bacterium TWA4]|nr:putative hydrolase [Lachnospiraceae bacterium TWA4]
MAELFEILNEDGSSTGILKDREKVHTDGDLHGSVHIWMYRFTSDGRIEVLLQKRSEKKDSFPGYFAASSAGHLDPGEDAITGGLRELNEELGVKAKAEDLEFIQQEYFEGIDYFHGKRFHNRELVSQYLLQVDKEPIFSLQLEEVSAVVWMDSEEIFNRLNDEDFKNCVEPHEYAKVIEIFRKNRRLKQQMAFILEVDKEKFIGRQTYLSDGSRKENDAEHAWHLAIMAMLLGEHANEKVDTLRVMSMVLIHDLVEIDAGDTYAYDTVMGATQRERELKAADRIFHLLPPDQAEYVRGLWDEFEEEKTPEAKFARTLDKVQPLMLNVASGGRSWEEHKVHKSQVVNRNKRTPLGSKELWELCRRWINEKTKEGKLIDD